MEKLIMEELQRQISDKLYIAFDDNAEIESNALDKSQDYLLLILLKMYEKPEIEINLEAFIPFLKPLLRVFIQKTLNGDFEVKKDENCYFKEVEFQQ